MAKYSYSGATSLHLGHYSDVLLDEQPDEVIIHVGTNDIVGRSRRDVSSAEIARNIIDIGGKCRSKGVDKIYISSIITTRNIQGNKKAMDINGILERLCVENDFIYISNDFLSIADLNINDNVHLSSNGLNNLVNNYIGILNGY